jgi:heme-degrading monooxygenase HmoA
MREDSMIVRMWRGPVPKAKTAAYIDYLKQTGLKDYQDIQGNKGVYLLTRDIGDQVEFLTMTFWDSIESVQGFAGEDYMRARYYPEDEKFLTVFNPLVEHFEVEAMPEDLAKLKRPA